MKLRKQWVDFAFFNGLFEMKEASNFEITFIWSKQTGIYKAWKNNKLFCGNQKFTVTFQSEVKKPATKRAKKRIDLIEQTKKRRSQSIFQGKTKLDTKRHSDAQAIKQIEKELDIEISKPYEDLNVIMFCITKMLMKTTIQPEGQFHYWLNLITNVSG